MTAFRRNSPRPSPVRRSCVRHWETLCRKDGQYCRLTAAELSTLLLDYTGLTLEETNQTDLDAFTYVPGEDAYYWTTDPSNSAPPP